MKKPKVVRIYSENNDFQYIETIRRKREKRQRHKEFFVRTSGNTSSFAQRASSLA